MWHSDSCATLVVQPKDEAGVTVGRCVLFGSSALLPADTKDIWSNLYTFLRNP